jgi:uncharacterized membrane protein YraQ (UPF0718 family)
MQATCYYDPPNDVLFYYYAGSLKEPFLNQLSLSIMIPVAILAVLSIAFVMVIIIAVIIKKLKSRQRAKVKNLQTRCQVMYPPDPESSTIYEEIANDSKPEQNFMKENMAYHTVQEFQERVKSDTCL